MYDFIYRLNKTTNRPDGIRNLNRRVKMLTNEQAKEVAATILTQLGGRKFIAMTGAKNFLALNDGEGGMRFNIPRFPGVKINLIEIVLNGCDLYDVTFSRIFANKHTVISEHKDVYNDDLRPLFESETGLRTSL